MANKSLFSTGKTVPQPNTINVAGGEAFALTDKEALAQYVSTGTFNNTFYSTAEEQLDSVLQLANKLPAKFVAQTAVYAREQGKMKDSPCLLLAVLCARGELDLVRSVFGRVVTNFKQLSTFMRMVRSGVTGRKSFGTAVKKLINEFLNQDPTTLFYSRVGVGDPSIADVIKMTHPNPSTKAHKALFAYFIGRPYDFNGLPEAVQQYELYLKANETERQRMEVPKVPFQLLTTLNLNSEQWGAIAMSGGWNMVRMNINTFQRHNALTPEVVKNVATKLRNPELVQKFNAFPYQLMTTYQQTQSVSHEISEALQDAMELATSNVPAFGCKTIVAVDFSGSMTMAVTGSREGSTSVTTCNQVASLIASVVLRQNKNAEVYRFDTNAQKVNLNPRDSVMTNAQKISLNGGGTDCSAGLRLANQLGEKADLFIIVSDNCSWAHYNNLTIKEWAIFKRRNPKAKLVQIDLAPYSTTNVPTDKDVLNLGGFADSMWQVIKDFVSGTKNAWVNSVESVSV